MSGGRLPFQGGGLMHEFAVDPTDISNLEDLDSRKATITTGTMDVYVDGTSGSDSNDGLTVATPKKTLAAVMELVPRVVLHVVTVHMSGTFNEPGSYDVRRLLQVWDNSTQTGVLLLDGGTGRTDVGGGVKTATGSSTSSLVVAGAGWTVDAYAGYLVRVLTGPAAGQERLIQANTADTITPTQNFSVDPTVGATFDVVRPATTWQASSANAYLSLTPTGGSMKLSNVYFAGSKSSLYARNNANGYLFLETVTFNVTSSYSILGQTVPGLYLYMTKLGVVSGTLDINRVGAVGMIGVVKAACNVRDTFLFSFLRFGSRCSGGVTVENCTNNSTDTILGADSGYAVAKCSKSSGVGLTVKNSRLYIRAGDISNCTHGIEAVRSFLYLRGTTGSSNTGAGVYAHSDSLVHVYHGNAPTITGTVGNLSTDGTTEASTWAAIDGGTRVFDLNEGTLCKEVT